MSNGRAKAGGERGVNGEWYAGGEFLPSTQLGKQPTKARSRSTGKQEIAPFVWEVPAEGKTSLYRPISAFIDWPYWRATGIAIAAPTIIAAYSRNYPHFDANRILLLVEAWNNGERWMNDTND